MRTINKLKKWALSKPEQAIVIFMLITRLITILAYQRVTIFPDTEGYIELGKKLNTLSLAGYDGTRSPGYPVLLSIAGNSVSIAVVLQFILGIVTAVYVYKTLRILSFSTSVSLVATLLLNSLLHVIFYETAILTESLTLLVITLIFYFSFKIILFESKWKDIVILSLLPGYLVLIKPFYIFLPFVIYGLYTLKGFKFSRIINQKIVLLILPLISFLGWSYVNKTNTGYFVSSTYFGLNLSQNCVYFAENTSDEYKTIGTIYAKHREEAIKENKDVAMTIWFAREELMDTTKLSFSDFSNELGKYSKVTIKMNPAAYLKQVCISWVDFWKTAIYWNYPDFKISYIHKVFLLLWYIQSFLLQILKIGFIVLMPYHFVKFFRTRKIAPELIIVTVVFCASLLQAMVTYGTNSRFSYPFEFLMVTTILITFKKYLPGNKPA